MAQVQAESVMSYLIEMRFNDTLLSSGTAFIVSNRDESELYLITNRHNVTGRHQETGKHLSNHAGEPNNLLVHLNFRRPDKVIYSDSYTLGLYTGEYSEIPVWYEHPQLGARADFVALKLPFISNKDQILAYDIFNTYHLRKMKDDRAVFDLTVPIAVFPTSSVSVIGYPFGITVGGGTAIWATGFVASEPEMNYEGLPVFLIDCRTRQGQSGSPVISFHAARTNVLLEDDTAPMFSKPVYRFLGIYSGRINAESDLGKVWKVSALVELVESIPPSNS